jgi:hypothetical protein
MLFLPLLILASLLGSFAYIVPSEVVQKLPSKLLSKRNSCDLNDQITSPIMYHEYRQAECPPKHVMDFNDRGTLGK